MEVLLDSMLGDELPDGCDGCTLATNWFKVVYTRTPEDSE